MSDAPAIDMSGVWFSYGGPPVLRDVNLRVAPRELVCMLGPNGGGKTTLLKVMLGLLAPDRGRVRILGRAPDRARPLVGYAPQQVSFDAQFPVNVMDVVLMGTLGRRGVLGPHGRSDKAAAAGALEEVAIAHLRRRPFGELSGGQRQRALIARSLVCEPELILLDEPTAGLDAGVEGEFYDLLARLSERLTVVMVSHDVGFVSQFVGKVVCVRGTVAVHPTADLTGELIRDLYGQDIRLVRHDHDCLRQCPDAPGGSA